MFAYIVTWIIIFYVATTLIEIKILIIVIKWCLSKILVIIGNQKIIFYIIFFFLRSFNLIPPTTNHDPPQFRIYNLNYHYSYSNVSLLQMYYSSIQIYLHSNFLIIKIHSLSISSFFVMKIHLNCLFSLSVLNIYRISK